MSTVSGPEKTIETLTTYLKDKFVEHFNTKIKVELGLPSGEAAKDGVLFLLPLHIAENTNLTAEEKTRYQEEDEKGEVVECQKNPILYFDMKVLLGFEAKPDFRNSILLMQLKQIFKEYGQIKTDTENIGLKEMPELAMKDQIELWNNLGLKYRPSIVSRITVNLEPLRTWKYKKVLQKIIKANPKLEARNTKQMEEQKANSK
jgi:hypothetical protein